MAAGALDQVKNGPLFWVSGFWGREINRFYLCWAMALPAADRSTDRVTGALS